MLDLYLKMKIGASIIGIIFLIIYVVYVVIKEIKWRK